MSEEFPNTGMERTTETLTENSGELAESVTADSASEEKTADNTQGENSFCEDETSDEEKASENPDFPVQSPLFGGSGADYMLPYVPYGYTPDTYREKKEIKRISAAVSVPTYFLFFISLIWGTAAIFIMRVAGFPLDTIRKYLNDPAILQVVQIAMSVLFFIVPFSISAKVSGYRISDLAPYSVPQKNTVLPYLAMGVGFCMLSNLTASLGSQVFSDFGVDYSVSYGEDPKGVFGFLLTVISTAIIPALTEEFAFRGIVFGMLKKYGDGFAVLVSSLMFGIMHGNFDQMPFAFLVGLALAIIRVNTKSIWLCSLVHCINNLISVILSATVIGYRLTELTAVILYVVLILCGVIGICKIFDKENPTAFKKPDHCCSVAQKYKWFVFSPAFIAFVVLYIGKSVMYFF